MPLNLNSFTKYHGLTSPEAFVHAFESELALCGMSAEDDKLRVFPDFELRARDENFCPVNITKLYVRCSDVKIAFWIAHWGRTVTAAT